LRIARLSVLEPLELNRHQQGARTRLQRPNRRVPENADPCQDDRARLVGIAAVRKDILVAGRERLLLDAARLAARAEVVATVPFPLHWVGDFSVQESWI